MNDPQRPVSGTDPTRDPHAGHDEFLVAALAADDLDGDARTGAERQVTACTECRLLFDDLRAIAAATAVMPAMPRPRDFRLSADDAARLRPMGWRRFAAALAGTRFAVTRPLAVGLSALGLVGLLLSAIPGQGGFFGTAATAPQAFSQDNANLGEKSVHASDSGRTLSGAGAPQAAASAGAASAPAPEPSAAATTAATVAAASAAPADVSSPAASMVPGAGGGSFGSTGGDNPASLADVSPGAPVGLVSGGPYGANSGGAAPPDAASSAKLAPAAPETAGGSAPTGGASPLAVLSVLCLVAGIGLFLARTAAQRATRS